MIQYIDYEFPTCIICHCDAKKNLSSLYCGHIFHFKCINKWVKKKKKCPICREKTQKEDINKINYSILEKKFDFRKILKEIIKNLKNKDIMVK